MEENWIQLESMVRNRKGLTAPVRMLAAPLEDDML